MFHNRRAIVLRKIAGRLEACRAGTQDATPLYRHGATQVSAIALTLGSLCLMAVALIALVAFTGVAETALLLAFPAAATTRPLATILGELKALQTEFKGKPMPEDKATKFSELAAEAKALQDEADRERELKGLELFSREVPDPALPGGGDRGEPKSDTRKVAGYIGLGELFVNSEVFQKYREAGNATQGSAPLVVKSLRGPLVALSGAERKAVETALRETKAVITIGDGVLEPQRVSEIVRATEHPELRLRDILNTSTTGAEAIQYAKLTSYTRAAAPVAAQAAKPEATAEFEIVTTPVRTHAVWMPVTEQQIQDAGQLINMVEQELLFDLDQLLEEQVMYGSGAGQNFAGILTDADVLAAREEVGDTLLDKIRRAITDVRVSGYVPNGIAIHPIDWEEIVLLKGSDEHYIWSIVTTRDGTDRIWGVNVVETIGAENYTSADTTDERNVLVGDFIRGATLWDRQQNSVAMGWINDQFIKNMRTIRAERRAAFGVKRPKAFRKIETVAAVV